jgi:hypothetical protein
MSYEKLPAIAAKDLHVGCLNCSSAALVAPLDMVIAVGFGSSYVTKDGEIVYDEQLVDDGKYWTVQDAEDMAAQDPDHDWRIVKYGPLHGETFQRQERQSIYQWICVESNPGFA